MPQSNHQTYCAVHYKEVCRLAMLAGEVMASHGAEAYRIEDTVCRILKVTGFSYVEAYVSVTGISITLADPSLDHEMTLVKRISNRNNDLSQISLTNEISRRFVAGELLPEQAIDELKQIEGRRYYKTPLILLCYMVTSAFFTFMFGGYPLDALAATLVGLMVGLTAYYLGKLKPLGFVANFLASVILGVGCLIFVFWLPIGLHLQPVLSGSIMPLVPGLLLTVAIRDLLRGDYMSGLARGVEAIICAVTIAAGVSVVVHLYERTHGALVFSSPPTWFTGGQAWLIPPESLFQALCSFISTVAFLVLFNTEPKHLMYAGLAGAATWFVYCLAGHWGIGFAGSALLASLTASAFSYRMAYRLKAPVTIFFTGGIFCLVPGAGIYQTMYYFLGYDLVNGTVHLLNTLEVAALIAIAIAIHGSVSSLWRKIIKK